MEAWRPSEKATEKYNWIHAFPNAAAEVVALWFGEGDFDRTIEIAGRCGRDVDCNAAQILTILGSMHGMKCIPQRWIDPIGDELNTLVRGMKQMSIRALSRRTADVARTLVHSI